MSGILTNVLTGGATGAVSAVAGFATEVLKRVVDDPAQRDAMAIKLAELEASGALAELAADADLFKAQLADTASARAQTVALAASGSKIAWGAPVVSVMVVGAFTGMLIALALHATPPETKDLMNIMLGSLAASFGAVVQYWVGSSAGSRDKDATIRAAVGG